MQSWANISKLVAPCYGVIELKLGTTIEDSFCVIVKAPSKNGLDPLNLNNGFTKGKCDKLYKEKRNETFLETALREMYEESGIVSEQLNFLNNFHLEETTKEGKITVMYLVGIYISQTEHIFTYNNKELLFSGWVSIPDAIKILRPSRAKLLTDAYKAVKKSSNYEFTTGNEIKNIIIALKPVMENQDIDTNKMVSLSKTLTWVLRHKATDFNLQMDPEGFVKVNEICEKVKQLNKISINMIKTIVNNDEKKRFTLKSDGNIFFIRANQGHSVKRKLIIFDIL
jgi:hypothetical protein